MLVSLVLVIILFGVTAGMTKVDTDEWQSGFMTLTLVTVVLINLNAAVFQGEFQRIIILGGERYGPIKGHTPNLLFHYKPCFFH